MKYVNTDSYAENPGRVFLSDRKFRQIRRMLQLCFSERRYFNAQKQRINEYMAFGDTQPAMVYSLSPFTVCSYSDEMDAVIMLRFPDKLAQQYNLCAGTRLVTVNVYSYKNAYGIASDIFIGENYLDRYRDFTPVLALFLSHNEAELKAKTALFGEEVWSMVSDKMHDYAAAHPGM